MTIVGRAEVVVPDLGDTGGATLKTAFDAMIKQLSDDLDSRIFEATSVNDSTETQFTHNLGAERSELKILIYTGTGATKSLVKDPIQQGWVFADGDTTKTQFKVTTPSSGQPHTFTVVAIDGTQFRELVFQSLTTAPANPATGTVAAWADTTDRFLGKNSAGDILTIQGLTPKHVSGAFNAVPGFHYIVDTSGGPATGTLNASVLDYDLVQFSDARKTFNTNNFTIARNGNDIDGDTADLVLNTPGDGALLVGDNTNSNWVRASSGGAGGSGEAGINYFENGSFENDATTGVTASGVTAGAEESTPLIGTRSSKLTSQANVGTVDYAIVNIDNAIIDGEFILTTTARYKTDALITLGDWTVGVYNQTDAEYVTGEVDLRVDSDDLIELGFVPLSGKTYSLRVEFTDTTAGRELLIDELKCSNNPLPSSPIVGPVEHSFPSFNNITGLTVAAQADVSVQRVGSAAQLTLYAFFNGNGTDSAPNHIEWNLPTYQGESFTLVDGEYGCGAGLQNFPPGGQNSFDSVVRLIVSGGVIKFGNNDNSSAFPYTGTAFGHDAGARRIVNLTLNVTVPVVEWAGEGVTVTPNLRPATTRPVDATVLGMTGPSSFLDAQAVCRRFSDGTYWIDCQLYYNWGSSATSHTVTFNTFNMRTNAGGAFAFDSAASARTEGASIGATNLQSDFDAGVQFVRAGFMGKLDSKPSWFDEHIETFGVSHVIEPARIDRAGIVEEYDSYIIMQGAAGQTGSGNTNVRYLQVGGGNLLNNGGDHIDYFVNATDGGWFVINTSGKYEMYYMDQNGSSGCDFGIVINSTSAPFTAPLADRFAPSNTMGTNERSFISGTRYLNAGDIVRCVVDQTAGLETGAARVGVMIAKVS